VLVSERVAQPALNLRYSFRDYVAFETDARERHEFVRGLILAMAGGTLEHAARAAKVVALLSAELAGKRCRVFDSNARVRIPATGNAFYPDASVVCGGLEVDAEDPHSMTNPVVLVEVLSPTTAEYDLTDKLDEYKKLASARHVVHVSHDAVEVVVWSRGDAGWTAASFGLGKRAALGAIGCELDVDDIYRDPLGPTA
jgi:Uma2 family endonuclease